MQNHTYELFALQDVNGFLQAIPDDPWQGPTAYDATGPLADKMDAVGEIRRLSSMAAVGIKGLHQPCDALPVARNSGTASIIDWLDDAITEFEWRKNGVAIGDLMPT